MYRKWFEKASQKLKKHQFFQPEIKKAFQKASWIFQAGQDINKNVTGKTSHKYKRYIVFSAGKKKGMLKI